MTRSRSAVLVNCRACDYHEWFDDFVNADMARDQHELEMFNWRGGSDPCGPVAVAWRRSR